MTCDDEDGWRSVVACGRLAPVEESGLSSELLAGLGRVEIPLVDLFEDPIRTVSFEFVRLEPDRLTGRRKP